MRALTITYAFGPYAVGQTVTDATEIDRLSTGPNRQHVVAVNLPEPEPEPASEPEPTGATGATGDPAPAGDAADKSATRSAAKRA